MTARTKRVLGGDGEYHSATDVLSQWELAEYYGLTEPRRESVAIDPELVAAVERLQRGESGAA